MRTAENPATSAVSLLGTRSDSATSREGEETALPPQNPPLISPLVSSLLGASLPLLEEADGFLYTTVDEPCQQRTAVLTKLNNLTKHMKHKAKRPAHWDYAKRTGKEQALTGKLDRELKAARLSSDLEALSAVQSSRPLKPPTRKP